jgi:type II secretory pathway pseudopilin PulG
MEAIGTILIILFLTAAAAVGISTAFSKVKINSLQQDVVTMRMQTQSLYGNSSDYSGLTNDVAINAGLVPKSLQKGNGIAHSFGGPVTLSANDANASFFIDLEQLPHEACIQLSRFQPDVWHSISVNGANIESDASVTDIISNCEKSNNNQIVFEAR